MDPIVAALINPAFAAYTATLTYLTARRQTMNPALLAQYDAIDLSTIKFWMGVLHTLNPAFPAPPDTPPAPPA